MRSIFYIGRAPTSLTEPCIFSQDQSWPVIDTGVIFTDFRFLENSDQIYSSVVAQCAWYTSTPVCL